MTSLQVVCTGGTINVERNRFEPREDSRICPRVVFQIKVILPCESDLTQ